MEKNGTSMIDKIRGFVFALTFMEAPAFFAVYAVTGRTYSGSESSSAYVIYMVALLTAQVYFLIRKRLIRRTALKWLLFPLLFVGMAYFTAIVKHQSISFSNIRNIVLWQYSGILLAINLVSYKLEETMKKSLVFLMLFISVGSVISVLLPFLRGRQFYSIAGYSLTGSSFQAQTYYTALCIGVNLLFLLYSDYDKATKISSYVLLGIQLICIILYAGRGGMILALAYIVVFYFLNSRKSGNIKNKLIMIFIYLSIFTIIFLVVGQIVASSPVLQKRFDRVFSYIGNSGIELSQTSNRDIVYAKALQYVKQSPLVGYGMLGYMYLDGLNRYPHNIIMEMMLEGGVLYLIFWIIIIVSGYKRIRSNGNKMSFQFFLIPFLFVMVKLMFSGTYSYEMLFWFFVAYSHMFRKVKNYPIDEDSEMS